MLSIRTILLIIPIMFFYLLQSFFIALFVHAAWRFILQPQFNIVLTYLHWVFIIWILKVLLFDIFRIAIAVSEQQMVVKNNKEVQTKEL